MFTEIREFYPTPQKLINKMLCDIDFLTIKSILEPSAGKGDIVEVLKKKEYFRSALELIKLLDSTLEGEER